MLFIVFGSRVKHKELGEGEFFCPRCQATRHYKHKKAQRYFALYFVPLVPMGQLGEYVECQTCGAAFEPVVLTQKFAAAAQRPKQLSLAELVNSLPTQLANGAPVEYLYRDLTAAGLDREAALTMLNTALKDGKKTCATCGLSYASTVTHCAECHQVL
jgi:hypothetical protein